MPGRGGRYVALTLTRGREVVEAYMYTDSHESNVVGIRVYFNEFSPINKLILAVRFNSKGIAVKARIIFSYSKYFELT